VDDTENDDEVKNWANSLGLSYPLLQDQNGMIASQYGVSGIPHNAILDTSMKVIYTAAGYSTGLHSIILNHITNYYEAAYANQLNTNLTEYVQMGIDTLEITAVMENPYNHNVELYATFNGTDGFYSDSLMLYDDGGHNDGAAGDGVYGNSTLVPSVEKEFMVGLKTVDLDYNVNVVFDDLARFTSVGPVEFESFNRTTGFGSYLYYYITLRNTGLVATAENVMARLIVNDPYITNIIGNDQNFGDIDAGQTAVSTGKYVLVPSNLPPNHTINFELEIYGNGNLYWTDSSSIVVGIEDEDQNVPEVFSLKQNYPNPVQYLHLGCG